MRRMILALCGAMALLPAVAACASSAGQPAARPSTVSLRQADQGRQVSVAKQSTVLVRLDSTYWRFRPPSSSALRLLGVEVHRGAGGVPGSGKGTVVARYRAVAPGKAVLSASRAVCGEALRCSAAQSNFRVTVIVRR